MRGLYDLSARIIDREITIVSPGVFALGYVDQRRIFVVQVIGRSDTDLRAELKRWIGQYDKFKFEYSPSSYDAFERECELFHDFGEQRILDNEVHPIRPKGTPWTCPRCTIYTR
jgi:hypothetical protein